MLEFSRVCAPLAPAYDWYSFNVLPRLGKLVAGDDASYRYLAESIRMHPDQAALKAMMEQAGFDRVEVHNLMAGVVALHLGYQVLTGPRGVAPRPETHQRRNDMQEARNRDGRRPGHGRVGRSATWPTPSGSAAAASLGVQRPSASRRRPPAARLRAPRRSR